MSRFWKAAAVAAALSVASLAQATTLKFINFVATTAANPRVNGVAQLSYDECDDVTEASVQLHNLDRNAHYVVYIASNGPGTMVEVTTNNGGNASYRGTFPQDATTQCPAIYVFAGTLETFTVADLRAQALNASVAAAVFTDFDATTPDNQCVDGVGIMVYESATNRTHFAVAVNHLAPNTPYVIYAASNGNGALIDVVTNCRGIAVAQGDVVGDIAVDGPAFYVFIGTTSTMTMADLRAQAFPTN